jgi:hypothetical protein
MLTANAMKLRRGKIDITTLDHKNTEKNHIQNKKNLKAARNWCMQAIKK